MQNKSTITTKIALVACVFCLTTVWIIRYHQINQFYKAHTIKAEKFYSMNENVAFEDDFLALHEAAKGHFICVNNLEIVAFTDYINCMGISINTRETAIPEKLALISVRLQNTEGETSDIFFPNFSLFGVDSNPQFDYELFHSINPFISKNSWHISIPKGSDCDLILPYMLFENEYKRSIWENWNQYPFFLQITAFPTAKYIRLEN